jgi:hypothetical protein
MWDLSQSGIRCFDLCVGHFKVVYACFKAAYASSRCSALVERVRAAYAFLKMHTLSKFMFGLLGFDFEHVGLSKPLSQAHYLKLYCDRQDSIVIKTGDSKFW